MMSLCCSTLGMTRSQPCSSVQVSLAHWNQDEEYGGFGGPHAMVPGGYGALTDALAARLDVCLSTPVTAIAYDGDSVQVKTASGARVCLVRSHIRCCGKVQDCCIAAMQRV